MNHEKFGSFRRVFGSVRNWDDGPLECTFDQVRALLPHLTDDVLRSVLPVRPARYETFAVPPLLVRGSTWHTLDVNARENGHWSVHRGLPRRGKFVEEACSYAERHWGERLLDFKDLDWFEKHQRRVYYALCNETGLVVAEAAVFLARKYYEIMGYDPEQPVGLRPAVPGTPKPASDMLDDAALYVATDADEISELHGASETPSWHCSLCGGALPWGEPCVGCGGIVCFKPTDLMQTTALPRKVVAALLAAGYEFARSTDLARDVERAAWEASRSTR